MAARCRLAGWRVVTIDRQAPPDRAGVGRAVVCDLASPEAVDRLVSRLLDEGWKPDVLVLNAAAVAVDYHPPALEAQSFLDIVGANLAASATLLGQLPRLPGTMVVAVSSTAILVPTGRSLGYYASKLALHHVLRVMAKRDRTRRYKLFVLGPMSHGMRNAETAAPPPLARRLAALLAVSPEAAADRLFRFLSERRGCLTYPRRAALVFRLASVFGVVGP